MPQHIDIVLYGTKGEKLTTGVPDGATVGQERAGNSLRVRWLHHRHRTALPPISAEGRNTWMEEWLKKVMVEHTCPDCNGHKLKRQRLMVRIGD